MLFFGYTAPGFEYEPVKNAILHKSGNARIA